MPSRAVDAIASRAENRNNAAAFRKPGIMAERFHDDNDIKPMRDMRKLAPEDFNG
jgi:hypothetical protein